MASFFKRKPDPTKGVVREVSGIQTWAGIPAAKHLSQQMVDELLSINSRTELACLAMADLPASDERWVKDFLVDKFHEN